MHIMKNTNSKNFEGQSGKRSLPRYLSAGVLLVLIYCFTFQEGSAAGVLTPINSSLSPLQLRDHQVEVVINNGFAQTVVEQSFYNPNDQATEALYTVPVPEHASLSEMEIFKGDRVLRGEVVKKEDAERIYEEETSQGNDAGLAQKNGYQSFEFWVSPIAPQTEVRMRYVYYQPLKLDLGLGRYLYPMEEGGTDDSAAVQFWTRQEQVENHFSIRVVLKSAWPVQAIRAPGFSGQQFEDELGNTVYEYSSDSGDLSKDFVFYYQLEEGLPGRVELLSYREDDSKPGTFMLVVTPGEDLKPLTTGADYVFLLDVSGSMNGKLHTLVEGVKRTIGQMNPRDRFRILTFSDQAREYTKDWTPATPEQVQHALKVVDGLHTEGGTNLYAGLRAAVDGVNADRATSLILVTDAVANQGELDPKMFAELMEDHDLRVFGFLMGNSSNWPLMKVIADSSGGFYQSVSNADDIIGQVMLAKEKVLYESMHHVELKLKGVKTYDLSGHQYKKVFRGQQLLILGRYADDGHVSFAMDASITGQDKQYATEFELPEVDLGNPELERIWALTTIEDLEQQADVGQLDSGEAGDAIVDLALQYQLVTDDTSMIVLEDEGFERHGIDRLNKERVEKERVAQQQRNSQAVKSTRVDQNQPAFSKPAPRSSGGGGGGGALNPLFLIPLLGLGVWMRRRAAAADRKGKDVA